jgi:hypothetical protein
MPWRYGARHCAAGCGTELPAGARADAIWCSDKCRKQASRSRRLVLAEEVTERLSEDFLADREASARIPGRDPALAAAALDDVLAQVLEAGNLAAERGSKWAARAEMIRRHRPELWVEFTGSAILAAARPRGVGSCRWCDALSRAAVADEVITRDAATIKLLGPGCDRCTPTTPAAMTAAGPAGAGLAVRPGRTKAERIDALLAAITGPPAVLAALLTKSTGPELRDAADMARRTIGGRELVEPVRRNYAALVERAWQVNHKK